MAEPRTIRSPKEDIALREVLTVQDAQTRIKQAIVQGYYQALTPKQTSALIADIIKETAERYPESQREAIRQSLAINAQKWHYTFMESNRVLNLALLQRVAQTPSISVTNKTYTIDVRTIAGMNATQSKAIVERFRPFLTQDNAGIPLIEDYEKKVKLQIKNLASDPANLVRLDKNGNAYTVNMRNFAEMETRYKANLQDVQRLKDDGVKLVWTSSHVDASARCSPYQGRLFSMDGTSGNIDGERYTPLEDALLGPKGDGNGIINGYNCRHRLIEYQPKSKPPKEYDKETIRRENAINNRQRQYERDIRNAKIEESLLRKAGDKEQADQLRQDWQRTERNYQAYSLRNGRAFYDWRTKVTQEELNQG
jgi:hypothetical protein